MRLTTVAPKTVLVERDGVGGRRADQERGQGGVALGPSVVIVMSPTLPRVARWRLGRTRQPRAATTARHAAARPRPREAAELRRDPVVDPALAPFVERYWSVRWDRTGQPPFRSEVLSHPSVNVSVESGDRTRASAFALPAVLVHGVVDPAVHRRPGRRRPGDGGEVPPRRVPGVHRRAAGPQQRRPARRRARPRPRPACSPPSSPRTTTPTGPPSSTPPWRRWRPSRTAPTWTCWTLLAADDRRPLAGAGGPGGGARRD